jgi:hypothetical protein
VIGILANAICYFTTTFGVLFGAASVLSLTSVAVARYLVIAMPFTYASKVTPSVTKFVLGGVWFESILLSFPPVTWRPAVVLGVSNPDFQVNQTTEHRKSH